VLDTFNRNINYLRISVTDKCNLRCVYCMPQEGVPLLRHEDLLSFEEIVEFTRVAVHMGITKVRLTGGEPLVRRGIVTLVEMLSAIEGIYDFAMTTNGILLSEYAPILVKAGLHRVNVSLDTVDPDRYAEITRGGDLKAVIAGLIAARAAGLSPIKINCVIDDTDENYDAVGVQGFGHRMGFEVRLIKRMNLAEGNFSVVIGGTGGDCVHCNRLRLTSSGLVRPCLFNDLGFSVRELGAEAAIRQAVTAKPECGSCSSAMFHTIGG
jgi:GTP 3',8-cyclase